MISYVRAMYDFSGQPGSTELSIKVGEVVTVTRTDIGEGWWEGQNARGDVGLFPAAYVDVLSASEAQKYQDQRTVISPATTDSSASGNTGSNRYDQTADDDADEWEDDWDEDNDTYSEIGPSAGQHAGGGGGGGGGGVASHTNAVQATSYANSMYDSKHLPATPNDDTVSLASTNATTTTMSNPSATTLKKSGMFGKTSDSYILGLSLQKDKIPENEMVYIVNIDNFYVWLPNNSPYTVIVASPKKESKFKGMKTFIAYQLTPSFNNISVSKNTQTHTHTCINYYYYYVCVIVVVIVVVVYCQFGQECAKQRALNSAS